MSIDRVNVNNGAGLHVGKTTGAGGVSQQEGGFADVLSSVSKTVDLDQVFAAASDRYGVPVTLLKAVAKAESNFNPKAVSCAGAQGIMQLMPSTSESMGVRDPFDAEQNIMGGARLLSGLLKKYDGDVRLALASYNAGSGNVDKYGGIPPFPETQGYVTKVMGYLGDSLSAGTVTDASRGAFGAGGRPYNLGSSLFADTDNADPEELKNNILMQIYLLEKKLYSSFGNTDGDGLL